MMSTRPASASRFVGKPECHFLTACARDRISWHLCHDIPGLAFSESRTLSSSAPTFSLGLGQRVAKLCQEFPRHVPLDRAPTRATWIIRPGPCLKRASRSAVNDRPQSRTDTTLHASASPEAQPPCVPPHPARLEAPRRTLARSAGCLVLEQSPDLGKGKHLRPGIAEPRGYPARPRPEFAAEGQEARKTA